MSRGNDPKGGSQEPSSGREHQNQAQVELALTSAQAGTWEWDIETDELSWSRNAEALLGLAPGTFPGTHSAYMALLSEADRRMVQRALTRTLSSGSLYVVEHPVETPTGTRWLGARGQVLRDAHGKARRLTGIIADITTRKGTERELSEREERLRAFADAAFEGIAFSVRGVVIDANKAICRMLGYQQHELIGKRITDLVAVEDIDLVRAHITTGYEGSYEHRVVRRDGSIGHVEARGRAVTYQGQLARITALRDVTERKHMATEREQLANQLRQAQKMEAVGQLAGGIAHDFNNILSVVLGNIELAIFDIEQGAGAAGVLESLREARQSGKRAADVTAQLLAFSRRQPHRPVPVDLNTLVREMRGMLNHIVRENSKLTLQLGDDLGTVVVDPGQIQQVVMNLVANARDAMPNGGEITVSTRNLPARSRGAAAEREPPRVALSVVDTGSGMDAETLSHIFEPFFTTKPVGQGTGLGLSMASAIIDQAGGQLVAESEIGRGTSMSIILPRDTGAVAVAHAEPQELAAPQGRGVVLVCEDDRSVRSLMRRILGGAGYSLLEADSGEVALRLADQASTINLLITDVILPGLDGKQLSLQLRRKHPRARTLFCSGYAPDVVGDRGVVDMDLQFLAKPFTRAGLLTRVRELLQPA
ncbi:MAG TPA: PAS domain S-box protein [Polyangiaceae bacterium]